MRWFAGAVALLLVLAGAAVFGNPLCDGDCGNAAGARFFGVLLIVGGLLVSLGAWMWTWGDDDR